MAIVLFYMKKDWLLAAGLANDKYFLLYDISRLIAHLPFIARRETELKPLYNSHVRGFCIVGSVFLPDRIFTEKNYILNIQPAARIIFI